MLRLFAVAGFALAVTTFGASNNACAAPSAGRHDHASSLGMRPV